eukprot:388306-Rhodomonas_salina.1
MIPCSPKNCPGSAAISVSSPHHTASRSSQQYDWNARHERKPVVAVQSGGGCNLATSPAAPESPSCSPPAHRRRSCAPACPSSSSGAATGCAACSPTGTRLRLLSASLPLDSALCCKF